MSWVLLLLQTSLRNVLSSFLNVVIGLILLVGTAIFVVGGSLVDSMDKAMSRSIIGSIAGHAQVYQASSKDSPSLFEGWQIPDLDPMPDFSRVKGPLMAHPNVAAVVPQGINTAIVVYGNTIDQVLEKLRKSVSPGTRQPKERVESLKSHVRQMVSVIQSDMAKLDKVAAKGAVDPGSYADLRRASSQGFWSNFDLDPLGHLEFLENKIAYLVPDSDQIFLSYVGTDLDTFCASFDRTQVVDGQAVPKGQRGMLLSKYVYEDQFKLKAARRLDLLHEGITTKGKTIAKDPGLKDLVKQNKLQTREIVLQLDPLSTRKAVAILQQTLPSKEGDLAKLLSSFFDTDDLNLAARHKVFYEKLAPLLELYRVRPGDFLTIKAYTKSGFVSAVNVKVYGTFQFKGLEKSSVAGAASLMDLFTFRDLYGYVTPEKVAETRALQRAAGAKFVSREKAEDELFGGSSSVEETTQRTIDAGALLGGGKVQRADLVSRVYNREEIEKGVALGAAIVLKDPSQLKATMKELQDICDKEKLGLKVIDWQKAAGNLGQFVFVAKFILYFATFIIFVVALVIINNAVVMATLQRVREIGTLRAIGARRLFVLAMVLTETIVLGLVFGTVGALLGGALTVWLGQTGIPAANDWAYFFFSGPRLFPGLSLGSLVGAYFVVFLVTCASALYPALMAARVPPVRAMASED